MKILVTGGRGFIGSHFVEYCLSLGHSIIDIDKITYAANTELPHDNNPNYTLIKGDICLIDHIPNCDIIVNIAAESHVDNSIIAPSRFFDSNTQGVFNILELLRGKVYNRPLLLHISTDEVYGDIRTEYSKESDPLKPSNPYSASKAAAEMFIMAYCKTYGINYIITRSSNNYGPRQYNEKLIPQILHSLSNNQKIPIHGDGSYVRDWIYVKDNVTGIYVAMTEGEKNTVYNVSTNNHLTNLEVVSTVCSWFGIDNYMQHIDFIENRIGQDFRYSIDSSKIKHLNWKPIHTNGLYKFI